MKGTETGRQSSVLTEVRPRCLPVPGLPGLRRVSRVADSDSVLVLLSAVPRDMGRTVQEVEARLEPHSL